jgi:UDP:flavonoid glycosyltransferase YjiC (YdhE family)
VTVLGHRVQREKAEATGAAFRAYRHAPDADASRPETDLLRDWEAHTPIGAFARIRDNLMYGPAAAFARDVLEAGDADVIAWDYLVLGLGLGAEHRRIPNAAIVHTPYPLPAPGVPPFGLGLQPGPRARDAVLARVLARTFTPGMKALNAARAELGLAPHTGPYDQVANADRVLVLTAPEWDFAGDAPLPPNVRFCGPAGVTARGGEKDDPPLVLASFSTTFMDQRDLLARAIEALGDLPVRGLVTTGPSVDPARLPARGNVEVRDFVPHADVLPRASLVVTHAGLGTVHAALAHGVPLVCVPGGRDQNDVAARVVARGAGVRTSKRKLRPAIERALADPSLAAGAQRMAEAFAHHDGAARAADELEALGR